MWNAALIGAGYLLGTQWEHVSDFVGSLSTPVLLLVLAIGTGRVLWRVLRRRRRAGRAGTRGPRRR